MSEDTKLTELIINTLSPEQFEPITPSDTEIYLVEDDAEYATVEELATKQDVIDDLDSYVKNTDYATNTTAGVIKIKSTTYGTNIASDGSLYAPEKDLAGYNSLGRGAFIGKGTLENIKESLVTSVSDGKYATVEGLATKQDVINDLADIRTGASKGATAYQKPSTGIPKTDLASAVQTSLGKADTAIQSTADCVKTSGNQTVSGVKTFSNAGYNSGGITINNTEDGGASSIVFKTNGVKKGILGIDNGSKPIFEDSGNTIYNLVRNTRNTAVGSVSRPVYVNANGEVTACNNMQNKLTAGNNITIENDVISAKISELNNPFSLLDSKYSDHKLYNASWLIANGSYNGKRTIHKSAYELLLKLYNGTEIIEGISVKAVGDSTITDYDFVIDTANEQFKLPIKTKLASGSAVVGNGMTLGITDGTTNGGLQAKGYTPAGFIANPLQAGTSRYGTSIGSDITNDQMSGKTLGIATDGTKSGIETDSTGLYLYFYVGETVQNASLVDVGRIEEQLAGLTTVVKKYTNGQSGYRIWSDGYCEQWGYGSTGANVTTTLLKKFADTTYTITATTNGTTNNDVYGVNIKTKTVDSFVSYLGNAYSGFYWKASGYLAQGEY